MNPEVESQSVAHALFTNYFKQFQEDPLSILPFFGKDSTLFWNGEAYRGIDEIRRFLEVCPKIEFEIRGYDVQSVPGTDLWSMLVVYGYTKAYGRHTTRFQTTFYVESRTRDHVGFIRYQAYHSY